MSIAKYFESARKELLSVPQIKQVAEFLEAKTHVAIEYYFAGILVLLLLSIFSGFFAHPITHLIGFAYPFYAVRRVIPLMNNIYN